MQYKIVKTDDPERGPWKVQTHGYTYMLSLPNGTEVLAYHWHPRSTVDWPHLHVGRVNLTCDALLTHKQHLATGRVSVEEIVRYCLGDLGIPARRDNWSKLLGDSETRFKKWRTWA